MTNRLSSAASILMEHLQPLKDMLGWPVRRVRHRDRVPLEKSSLHVIWRIGTR